MINNAEVSFLTFYPALPCDEKLPDMIVVNESHPNHFACLFYPLSEWKSNGFFYRVKSSGYFDFKFFWVQIFKHWL